MYQNKQDNKEKFQSEAEALLFVLRSKQPPSGARFIYGGYYATEENRDFWTDLESYIKSLPIESHAGIKALHARKAGGLSEFLYKKVIKNELLPKTELDWIESARLV